MKLLQFIIITLFLSLPVGSSAHAVKLFATSQAGHISGQAYFSGGAPAGNCLLELRDAHSNVVLSWSTGDDGSFDQPLPPAIPAGEYMLLLKAGSGHQAQIALAIAAGHSPAMQPAPSPRNAASPVGSSLAGSGQPEPLAAQQQLQAIQQQLDAINKQLITLQAKQDDITPEKVIAGLGYILGLLGAATYFHYRPRSRRQQ